jgi:hypothetical protein
MIEWVNRVVIGGVGDLMRSARTNYGVDPVAFLVIYLASVPFFYYSIFRMVRAMARRKKNEITLWSTIFLAASVAPFLYVLFFGGCRGQSNASRTKQTTRGSCSRLPAIGRPGSASSLPASCTPRVRPGCSVSMAVQSSPPQSFPPGATRSAVTALRGRDP